MSNKVQVTYTFPIFTVLTLMFVYLKLTGSILWSWTRVFSPIWLPFAAFGGVMLVLLLGGLIWAMFSK